MSDLKPCPFCGSEASDPWFDEDAERGEVYCTICIASMQGSYQHWTRDKDDIQNSISEAIAAWNTRADLPLTTDQLLAAPRVKALVEALRGLKRIIEEIDGAMNHGSWRDDKGRRLKDTSEWVDAYNALAQLKEPK